MFWGGLTSSCCHLACKRTKILALREGRVFIHLNGREDASRISAPVGMRSRVQSMVEKLPLSGLGCAAWLAG